MAMKTQPLQIYGMPPKSYYGTLMAMQPKLSPKVLRKKKKNPGKSTEGWSSYVAEKKINEIALTKLDKNGFLYIYNWVPCYMADINRTLYSNYNKSC